MIHVAIRIPDQGETPLSFAEQQVANRLGIQPPRRYAQRFAWRKPWPRAAAADHPAPARATEGAIAP